MTARENYGSVFRGWVSIIPSVIISDPEHVQMILGSPKHTGKSFVYRLLHNFLGEGLITNTGNSFSKKTNILELTKV